MKKRLFSLLLAAAMLASVACAGDGPDDTASTTAAPTTVDSSQADTTVEETETTAAVYDVTGIRYDGYVFRTWRADPGSGWADTPNDLQADEQTGDVLNDAVYTRNRAVEDKLGIKLENVNKSASKLSSSVKNAVLSNNDEVDAVFPQFIKFPNMVNNDYLYDLNEISTFDFSQPWWNQSAVDSMTIHGKLFGTVGDLTFVDKLSTVVTFYNMNLVDSLQMGDMYALVESGEWTIDKMTELGKQVSKDVDNNGTWDMQDAYGISCQNDGSYFLLHSAGLRICDKNEEGDIYFSLANEKAINTLQTIFTLMMDESMYFNAHTFSAAVADGINMFNDNRALFYIRPVQTLFRMRSMNADFGILPTPKIYDSQETYSSSFNAWTANLTAMPKSVADPDRAATILTLLAYESYAQVLDPLYEVVLGTKLIRDDSSSKMLDLAFDGVVYDVGLIWNFGDIVSKLNKNQSTNVASMLTMYEKIVNNAIDDANEKFKS